MDHCFPHRENVDLILQGNSYNFTSLKRNPRRKPIRLIAGVASWTYFWRRSVRLNV